MEAAPTAVANIVAVKEVSEYCPLQKKYSLYPPFLLRLNAIIKVTTKYKITIDKSI